jgi:hypothetical protein
MKSDVMISGVQRSLAKTPDRRLIPCYLRTM